MKKSPFRVEVKPDWEAFLACLRREGTPKRVHFVDFWIDVEIREELCRRYELLDGVSAADPFFAQKRDVAVRRFLGQDFVLCPLGGTTFPRESLATEDTAALARAGGRTFVNEQKGPVTTREEFDRYPWPDPARLATKTLEWYEKNLPDNMCIIGGPTGHIMEEISFLMGYETLALSLYDQRDLVRDISRKVVDVFTAEVRILVQHHRVKAILASDDMGFKNGTLLSPEDMREFVLYGHRELARIAHEANLPFLLHSCGKLDPIMGDLLDDVRIDGKHSFEDVIEDIRDAKRAYGNRCAVLGGIDVDLVCRASEKDIRRRVREVVEVCQPGGGFALGMGNSVANYVPLDNYLSLLDEGRR